MSPFLLVFIAQLSFAAAHPPGPICKEVPTSPGWPSRSAWAKLNETIGGNLLAPLPPAIVCDHRSSHYSSSKCDALGEEFLLASFHDSDPVSVHWPNWQDDACLPSALYNGTCELRPFPKYTVNASEAGHVVEAVKFASRHNIRLSVKNTGHDYLGRSTSPEFSLWTHHLKDIEVLESFQSKNCSRYAPQRAMKLGAGNQFYEIYTAAAKHDLLVAGGSEASVGLGGWLTSGGHSPLGAVVGLGVDNVMEMEVVTPLGELLTINECNHPDLLWAMRGGGGSTFGVMVSVTMKTYPNSPGANFTMVFESSEDEANKNNNTNFWNLLADMYGHVTEWSESNINGFFSSSPIATGGPEDIANPVIGFPNPNISRPMRLAFTGYAVNQTEAELRAHLADFQRQMNSTLGIKGSANFSSVERSTDFLSQSLESTGAGSNNALSSRLWPKETLRNKTALIEFLRKTQGNPIEGLMVSGPAVRDFAEPELTSVTPAWRRTYIHTASGVAWAYRNATQSKEKQSYSTSLLARSMEELAPDMGCYMNEADRNEPNANQAFWGENYARLLELKRLYDPKGVFWCIPCIGHQDWEMDEQNGRLCRVH